MAIAAPITFASSMSGNFPSVPAVSLSIPVSSLTDGQRRRLEQEQEALQDEYDLLNTKLRRLRKARAIEADTAVEIKLDMQIEEIEKSLDEVE
jgi:hypothetical protein